MSSFRQSVLLEPWSRLTSSLLEDDGEGNVQSYNDELATFSAEERGWSNMNWLFAECYVYVAVRWRTTAELRYRRLRTFFAMTSHWKTFDPFFQSKADTYRSSSGAIIRKLAQASDACPDTQIWLRPSTQWSSARICRRDGKQRARRWRSPSCE